MASLRKNMEAVGCSFKKEILLYLLIAFLFLGAGAALWYFRGADVLLLVPTAGLVVFSFFFFSRYSTIRKARLAQLNDEFVTLFTFFGIYINDGFNVYNALEAIQAYASSSFRAHLGQLLKEIEEDKSVRPYVNFAEKMESLQIKEVMISIYQMVDEGGGGAYIQQFRHLFGALSDQRHEEQREKRMSSLETLAILPLAGSAVAMVVLALSIVEIMGGIMSVL